MDKSSPKCHDCGVEEGEVHWYGCEVEVCPFCGEQLIGCDCKYRALGLYSRKKYTKETQYIQPEAFNHGLTEVQDEQWRSILEEKGLIPFIEYPLICVKCGMLWPEFFDVPKEEWEYYIQPDMRKEVICKTCYEHIKQVIDSKVSG